MYTSNSYLYKVRKRIIMPKRHCVQIPDDLWKKLCDDASKQMKQLKKSVTPSKRVREIIEEHFKKKSEVSINEKG